MEGAPLPQRARGFWKAQFSAARDKVEAFLEAERAQLPPWAVVAFGTGIAAWFVLDSATQWAGFLIASTGMAVAGFVLGNGRAGRAAGWFALAAALGCALVWARSVQVAAPVVDRPTFPTFEARVERAEPLVAKGDIRLTLAPLDPALPPRVRVSISQDKAPPGLAAGARVRLRARLVAPPPMALPGGYDFARTAWFAGIGGVGRALGEVTVLEPRSASGIDGARHSLGRHIREQLPGSAGTIASTLANGDQNAISEADAESMRRSGLAHLLSVSGLHITAVIGAAMLLTIKLLALSQRLALRTNLVLVAAGVGALAGIAYTLLTGAQVPTIRSCIAALLVLAGLALGRDAISLRLIAVGAFVILLFRPEVLMGASFQFSFAAVTAIVALHSTGWAKRVFHRRAEGLPAAFGRGLLALLATGLAVEIALTPLALYHFHKAGLYSVAANLVAIPLTTFVVMPLEAGALLLDLIGVGAPLWFLTGLSIDLLLWVARSAATAPGAVAMLASMPQWAFGLMVAGGLWLCLWTSRARLLGVVPFALGAIGAATAPVPDVLVTGDGKHLAVVDRTGAPRILRNRTGDFMRDVFTETAGFDGEPLLLESAAFASCSRDACVGSLAAQGRLWRLLATRSSNWLEWREMIDSCSASDIVVSDRWLPRDCRPRWLKLDRKALEQTGGVAIYLGDEPRVETVADRIGQHPWASAKTSAISSQR